MKRTERGTSLLESMTYLAIAAILLSMALPFTRSLLLQQRKSTDINLLLNALHFARTEAVLSRTSVTLCSGDGACAASSRWSGDLLVFSDGNRNGKLDGDDRLLLHSARATHFHWQWNSFQKRAHIQFEADGTTRAQNGTFTLCQGDTALHQVVVNLIGRIRTQAPDATNACLD